MSSAEAPARPTVDHVIVLALENRAFDHLLGFLDHPDPGFDGVRSGGPYTNPGWDGGPAVEATPTAKAVLPVDPDHSHDAVMEQLGVRGRGAGRRPTNQGFVSSYERKGRGLAVASFGGLLGWLINWNLRRKQAQQAPVTGRGPLAMGCHGPDQVPVISTLARQFAVCTRWFCSVPGETWPNRNFLHAATSDGETNIAARFYTNPTIFELLESAGKSWHIYHDDTPQIWAFVNLWDSTDRHANWFHLPEFASHVENDELPSYSFIEPNHRPPLHTLDRSPRFGGEPGVSNSQHPGNNRVSNEAYDGFTPGTATDFSRAEQLIATVYEALRANPKVFERSVLLITYDEHGGLYDHVPPPTDVPSPGQEANVGRWLLHRLFFRRSKAFDFRMLGPRVPAVVVSPFIPPQTVSSEVRDHASVPSTLRALFAPGVAPLNARDGWAAPFHTLLTLPEPRHHDLPDLSAAASADLHAAPATGVAPPTPVPVGADTGAEAVPEHYVDMVKLADKVGKRLERQGVRPAMVARRQTGTSKARDVSQAFMQQADQARARRGAAPPGSPPPARRRRRGRRP